MLSSELEQVPSLHCLRMFKRISGKHESREPLRREARKNAGDAPLPKLGDGVGEDCFRGA